MRLTTIPLLMAYLATGMAQAQAPHAAPVHFVLVKEDEASVSQIVGLCDGSRDDDEFACRLARINLVKGDDIQRSVLGGGPEQCFLGVSSNGQDIKFHRTADNTWVATSPPSAMCGMVNGYTLVSASARGSWTLTVASKMTDRSMPMCKSLRDTSEEFSIGMPSLACQGVQFGPNPGF